MFGLRRHFLLDSNITYLNHGSFGATPTPVFREYQHWQRELERQPVEFLGRRFNELMRSARGVLADYLHAEPDDLVYITNATTGVNIIARSLKLGPGDEVLATNHEYGACDRTWRFLAKKRGFQYLNQQIPVPIKSPEGFVESFWQGVNSRTRLIYISHITSPTAIIFPVSEVVKRARGAGILTIIDGAHAPGQIPLNLTDLGADFYTGNLHKWLCTPKGCAFLHARPEVQPLLEPLVVSWGFESENPGSSQFIDHQEFWGTRDIAAFLSTPAAIQFQEKHDWQKVRTACHHLLSSARDLVSEVTGQPLLNPDSPEWYAQMSSVPLDPGVDIIVLKETLYDKYRIEIPLLEWNGLKLIRLSIQGYNSRRDVERLVEVLRKVM